MQKKNKTANTTSGTPAKKSVPRGKKSTGSVRKRPSVQNEGLSSTDSDDLEKDSELNNILDAAEKKKAERRSSRNVQKK